MRGNPSKNTKANQKEKEEKNFLKREAKQLYSSMLWQLQTKEPTQKDKKNTNPLKKKPLCLVS